MMADLLIEKFGGNPFTWVAAAFMTPARFAPPTSTRSRPPTITTFGPLLAFARA